MFHVTRVPPSHSQKRNLGSTPRSISLTLVSIDLRSFGHSHIISDKPQVHPRDQQRHARRLFSLTVISLPYSSPQIYSLPSFLLSDRLLQGPSTWW